MARATDRLRLLVGALEAGEEPEQTGKRGLRRRLTLRLSEARNSDIWLTLSVLNGRFPTAEQVIAARRRLLLDGPAELIKDLLHSARARRLTPYGRARKVRIVSDSVIVDVQHTSRTGLGTGIQRVVRNTLASWYGMQSVTLVGWNTSFGGLRELSEPERSNALHGDRPHARPKGRSELVVPWRTTYVLLELAIERERVARISALAEYSGNATCVIGYDCVPLTTAETVGDGMGAAFANNLSAVSRMDKVATISISATIEYEGWRRMLSGAGLSGPEVREIVLPTEAETVSDRTIEDVRAELNAGDLPIVLCVGSHEPRKNHLAVLQAAEQLWVAGRKFSLVFIGGNSWGGKDFEAELNRLRSSGRTVSTISAVSDEFLWAAYRVATCTVFPSLNEGFGLPVAESLAAGTPVVTSRFGSMQELARTGGALLIDPRDDSQIAAAIESVLFDSRVQARLRKEALAVPRRSWGEYESELWDYFVQPAKI
jgi:glycosyltransferase involved in cell wall biosynthesis